MEPRFNAPLPSSRSRRQNRRMVTVT